MAQKRNLYETFGVNQGLETAGRRGSGGGRMINTSSLGKKLGLKGVKKGTKTDYSVTEKGAKDAKKYNPEDYSMMRTKQLRNNRKAIRDDLADELSMKRLNGKIAAKKKIADVRRSRKGK